MNEKLDSLILNARLTHNDRELILGFLRYETIRRLNPRQFAELHRRNIKNHENFDEMIDGLIEKNYIDKSAPKV